MADLRSRFWIVFKGFAFLIIIIILAGGIILLEDRWWARLAAYLIGMWAAARFYYFCFYVLERYVGLEGRYAGLLDLVRRLWRKNKR